MCDFIKQFFLGLYWGSNFATKGNRAKGVKPLFSHWNFVHVMIDLTIVSSMGNKN